MESRRTTPMIGNASDVKVFNLSLAGTDSADQLTEETFFTNQSSLSGHDFHMVDHMVLVKDKLIITGVCRRCGAMIRKKVANEKDLSRVTPANRMEHVGVQ